MNPVHNRTTITTEYRFVIDPAEPIKTRDGSFEITEARVTVYDDGDRNVDFYGYRTRQDGQRTANAAFGLVTAIAFDEATAVAFNVPPTPNRQTLEAEVDQWLAAYPKPAQTGGTS